MGTTTSLERGGFMSGLAVSQPTLHPPSSLGARDRASTDGLGMPAPYPFARAPGTNGTKALYRQGSGPGERGGVASFKVSQAVEAAKRGQSPRDVIRQLTADAGGRGEE